MFIESIEGKIKALHKSIDNDFLGLTVKDGSKELVNKIIEMFPKIRVIEQPMFSISVFSPPNLSIYKQNSKPDLDVEAIAFETSTWKFSDVRELANFIDTMEFIFLYKLEIVSIPSGPNTYASTFITARMVPIGWTDIISKRLQNFKF